MRLLKKLVSLALIICIVLSLSISSFAYVSDNQPTASFSGGTLWSTGEPYVYIRAADGHSYGTFNFGDSYYFDGVTSDGKKAYFTSVLGNIAYVDVRYLSTEPV